LVTVCVMLFTPRDSLPFSRFFFLVVQTDQSCTYISSPPPPPPLRPATPPPPPPPCPLPPLAPRVAGPLGYASWRARLCRHPSPPPPPPPTQHTTKPPDPNVTFSAIREFYPSRTSAPPRSAPTPPKSSIATPYTFSGPSRTVLVSSTPHVRFVFYSLPHQTAPPPSGVSHLLAFITFRLLQYLASLDQMISPPTPNPSNRNITSSRLFFSFRTTSYIQYGLSFAFTPHVFFSFTLCLSNSNITPI